MELRHLRYFVAVAEEGGFSAAARRLHVVQPTLSMQIRDLEHELGGPLFDRGGRPRLTPAGEAFLIEARQVLAQAERARDTARSAIRGDTGSVRIGVAGAAVFGGLLTGLIGEFHQARPLVRIELREAGPQAQRAAILAGELDVGFSALPAPADEPRLASTPASSVSFLVALPAGHRLAGHRMLTAEQIAGEELVEYITGDDDLAPRGLLGHRPNLPGSPARFRADSTLSVLALVAAKAGLAVVPAGVEQAGVPDVVYRPLTEPGLTTDFHLLYRSIEPAPAVAVFVRTCT